MRVLLVGNYLPDRQESMQRFAALIRSELEHSGHEVEVICPTAVVNRKGAPPVGMAKWLGYVDKFVLFPRTLRKAAKKVDLVHICDHSNAPYVSALKGVPHLVTCHDVLAIRSALGQVPENRTGWSGKILQSVILKGLANARKIVCDSRKTQSELLSVLPGDGHHADTEVIYISLNHPYEPNGLDESRQILSDHDARLAKKLASGREFVLHVGGNQWYKNRLGVLRVFDRMRGLLPSGEVPLLVMAGKEFTPEMELYVKEQGLDEDVLCIQDCSNEVLQALYSSAQLLLFPSLAEGFGWPIIEAQVCGCRVVTSDRAPMTELGGEHAVYVDPDNEPETARLVAELMQEPAADRAARVEAGFANTVRFSREQMTRSYLAAYAELLSSQSIV